MEERKRAIVAVGFLPGLHPRDVSDPLPWVLVSGGRIEETSGGRETVSPSRFSTLGDLSGKPPYLASSRNSLLARLAKRGH